MHLTPRQLDIVRFILQYRARWGFSPTLQEIGDHLGVSAVTVFEHARALERKRAIRRTPNQARSLEVIDRELLQAYGPARLARSQRNLTLPLVGVIAAGQPIEALEDVEDVNLSEMLALDGAMAGDMPLGAKGGAVGRVIDIDTNEAGSTIRTWPCPPMLPNASGTSGSCMNP